MNYPILGIEHKGFTQMIPSEAYWASLPLAFINLYKRRLDTLVFYDKDGYRWHLRSINPRETIGPVLRVVGLWLGLSLRPVSVAVDFQPGGPYTAEDLRAALRSAVDADDDIICQYHSKEQIRAWLDQAQSVAKIFNLYNRATKESSRRKSSPAAE